MTECGDCTLCCRLLPVQWMDSPAGELCSECEEGIGCRIFEEVDERCKKFSCMYNQVENARIELRPDNCGVIFEKLNDKLIFGTVEDEMTEHGKAQCHSFVKQGFSVVLDSWKNKKLFVLAEEGRTKDEVIREFKKWQVHHIQQI